MSQPVALPADQMPGMRIDPLANDLVNAHEFRLEKLVSKIECEAEVHAEDKWLIHAHLSEPLPEKVNLKDVLFTMTNVTQNKVFSNYRWYLHGYRPLYALKV
ncbi:hypothetical protein RAB80_014076 [Fusarium oxysporum f. sp. vasinfectum]|nr:hypothetical protein RAB80_014076 [Fusarium oxysporum f. sp. vasinfectum]KAK2923185.1 hypothetical protein FoTM2_016707 [Fusarium oxysporum f. sp. vasinfectum]